MRQAAELLPSALGNSIDRLEYFGVRAKVIVLDALEALQRHDGKQAEDALSFFRKELLEDPAFFPCGRFFMGMAYYEQERWSSAIVEYQAYLARYPADENAWFYMGNAYARLEHWPEALEAYDHAIRQNADFEECIVNVGQILRRMGDQETVDALQQRSAWIAQRLALPDFVPYIQTTAELLERQQVRAEDIPIFINSRDRIGCLKKLLAWLDQAGYRNIYILDNDSTYAPLIDYYHKLEQQGMQVIYLRHNLGHTALWDSRILEILHIRTPYVYTDSDVLPGKRCPKDLVERCLSVLVKHPFLEKVGLGLHYEDITFPDKDRIQMHESSYYTVPIEQDVFFAPLDTTFALYQNSRHYTLQVAARLTGEYMGDHLPWYYDYEQLPVDELYYLEHANQSSSLGRYWRQNKDI